MARRTPSRAASHAAGDATPRRGGGQLRKATARETKELTIERCAGCGILAKVEKGGHPYVGVMHDQDAVALGYEDTNPSERGFVAVPVCEPCWRDPEHRINQLKAHFFKREVAADAVRAAGFNDIRGGA